MSLEKGRYDIFVFIWTLKSWGKTKEEVPESNILWTMMTLFMAIELLLSIWDVKVRLSHTGQVWTQKNTSQLETLPCLESTSGWTSAGRWRKEIKFLSGSCQWTGPQLQRRGSNPSGWWGSTWHCLELLQQKSSLNRFLKKPFERFDQWPMLLTLYNR